MSNISNVHQFVALDKNTKALSGQRLVRLIAKADRNGKYASDNLTTSIAVSIPPMSMEIVADKIDLLIPYVIKLVEDTQDKIIREFRIEHGRDEVPEDAFSIDNCIQYLAESSAGDRVTKEYLHGWFDSTYGEAVRSWINAISGNVLDAAVVESKAIVIRDFFAGFASNKYSPNIPTCKAMVRFGQAMESQDAADARLIAYTDKALAIQTRKEEELSSDALGF
jgi:hypothetical protein